MDHPDPPAAAAEVRRLPRCGTHGGILGATRKCVPGLNTRAHLSSGGCFQAGDASGASGGAAAVEDIASANLLATFLSFVSFVFSDKDAGVCHRCAACVRTRSRVGHFLWRLICPELVGLCRNLAFRQDVLDNHDLHYRGQTCQRIFAQRQPECHGFALQTGKAQATSYMAG